LALLALLVALLVPLVCKVQQVLRAVLKDLLGSKAKLVLSEPQGLPVKLASRVQLVKLV